MIGIYKITNLVNGKSYIGQSINIQQRWKTHRNRYQVEDTLLYRAIRKYGLDNFSFKVIEECQKNELNEREIYWIQYYDTTNREKGYNLTKGGNTACPAKCSDEIVIEALKKYNSIRQVLLSIGLSKGGCNYIRIKNILTQCPELQEKFTEKGSVQHFCKDCGKPIKDSASGLCNICVRKLSRIVKDRPSREELKQMIRTMSFVKIGEQYGISDNAIRKWCKLYELPYRKKDIKLYSDEEWEKL